MFRVQPADKPRSTLRGLTRLLPATALAICLAGQSAWGHRFPELRTVVVQVEACEVALLVGFQPASGQETDLILTRAANAPKGLGLESLETQLTARAMGPLTLSLDGTPLVPTSAQAKIGVEPGGARPMVVILVTYALPAGRHLSLTSTQGKSTRISWQDRASGRIAIPAAPAQGSWHNGVASFLLELTAPTGVSTCAPRLPPPSAYSRSARR
jgi:hypothetical protein